MNCRGCVDSAIFVGNISYGRTHHAPTFRDCAGSLGSVVGGVVFVASVPVSNAASNITSWMHWSGLSDTLDYVQISRLVDLLSIVAGLLGLLSTAVMFILLRRANAAKASAEEKARFLSSVIRSK